MFIDSILIPLAERGLLLEEKPGYLEWELSSHTEIYDCIAGRDGEKAKSAMAKHIEHSKTVLFEMLP